jgi:excisionase family DNA binding protein
VAQNQGDVGLSDDRQALDPILASVAETAQTLAISESKTRDLIASGELLSVHIGRRVLVPRAAVQRYVDRAMAGRTI